MCMDGSCMCAYNQMGGGTWMQDHISVPGSALQAFCDSANHPVTEFLW